MYIDKWLPVASRVVRPLLIRDLFPYAQAPQISSQQTYGGLTFFFGGEGMQLLLQQGCYCLVISRGGHSSDFFPKPCSARADRRMVSHKISPRCSRPNVAPILPRLKRVQAQNLFQSFRQW